MSDDDPPPAGQRVSPKDFAPFALAALIGLASIALPGPGLDWTLFAVATGLTVLIAIAGFAAAVTGRAPIMMLPPCCSCPRSSTGSPGTRRARGAARCCG